LDVSSAQLSAAQLASVAYRVTSLDAPVTISRTESWRDGIGGLDPAFARVEDRLTLLQLMTGLSERERRVLRMRFIGEMSQTEIAKVLGVSQMQVSRILSAIMNKLRRGMLDSAA
jgi:RNA polymerase sigma-B factor